MAGSNYHSNHQEFPERLIHIIEAFRQTIQLPKSRRNAEYTFELCHEKDSIDLLKDLKLWIPVPHDWDAQKTVKILNPFYYLAGEIQPFWIKLGSPVNMAIPLRGNELNRTHTELHQTKVTYYYFAKNRCRACIWPASDSNLWKIIPLIFAIKS